MCVVLGGCRGCRGVVDVCFARSLPNVVYSLSLLSQYFVFSAYVVVVVRSVLRVVVYVFVDRSEVLSCQVRV